MLRQRGYIVDIHSYAAHTATPTASSSGTSVHVDALSQGSSSVSKDLPTPSVIAMRSCLWAAGFSFSRATDTLESVPYDGTLSGLFFGEEQSIAAR
jgi:hypothetical protein